MMTEMQKRRNPICCWQECKLAQPLWTIVWQFLKKLNMNLPYERAFPFLGVCLKEMKIYVHSQAYAQIFPAAVLAIAQNCKQLKHSSIAKWIAYTGILLAIKENELVLFFFLSKMNLKNIFERVKEGNTCNSIYMKC